MTAPVAVSPRNGTARLFAAGAAVLSIAATAVAVWLSADNGTSATSSGFSLRLAFTMYLVVGILLLVRRPENRLAWLITTVGMIPSVGVAVEEYARLALIEHPELPGGVAAAWLSQLWWFPILAVVFIFVPLLFPTGHLPTARWRWLARLAAAAVALIVLMEAFGPDLTGRNGYEIANPLAVSWVEDAERGIVGGALFATVALCMFLTMVSLILRFRRARGVERQQLKWFVFAGMIVISLPLLELMKVEFAGGAIFDMTMSLIPASIGVAILRYRLFDIDRLISRTLTYAVLTAVLLALYLGAVTAMTHVAAPVAGDSPFAVAAATLLAAAAFGPARRWIQSIVDRRFNRARYDAARTVDQFRSHLRDELDLASITAGVRGAVEETLQPSRVAVWLRREAL